MQADPAGTRYGWTRFDTAMLAFTLAVAVPSLVGLRACGVSIAARSVLPDSIALVVLGLLSIRYTRVRERRLLDLCRFAAWGIVFGVLIELPIYLAARRHVPLHDQTLAAFDRALGLEIPSILAWSARHPVAARALYFDYYSLTLLCIVALLVPPLTRQAQRGRQLLCAFAICLLATVAIDWSFQAIGPWAAYRVTAFPEQTRLGADIAALKSQARYTLDFGNLAPLVAFPSFHVILAVISASALAQARWLRGFALAWAGSIIVATTTTGWHYVADVLGGLAVGIGAVLAARWIEPRWFSDAPG